MDDRGKRKLFRAICDALTVAGIDLSHVHLMSFHRRDDTAPDLDRYVIVALYEIQRKVQEAIPGRKFASWEGTGRFRVQVYDSRGMSRVASFPQGKSGTFPIGSIVAKTAEYVTEVRDYLERERRREAAEAANEADLAQLVRDFRLNEFAEKEHVGWRKNIAPVEAEAYFDGLTLNFNRRLTANEARALLRCARDLGLLPGGVREKDRTGEVDTRNRYERV